MVTKFSEENQELKTPDSDLPPVDLELIAQGVRLILEGLGENPERAGLLETPRRVAEMYAELTSGMREDPNQHVVPLPGDKFWTGVTLARAQARYPNWNLTPYRDALLG